MNLFCWCMQILLWNLPFSIICLASFLLLFQSFLIIFLCGTWFIKAKAEPLMVGAWVRIMWKHYVKLSVEVKSFMKACLVRCILEKWEIWGHWQSQQSLFDLAHVYKYNHIIKWDNTSIIAKEKKTWWDLFLKHYYYRQCLFLSSRWMVPCPKFISTIYMKVTTVLSSALWASNCYRFWNSKSFLILSVTL